MESSAKASRLLSCVVFLSAACTAAAQRGGAAHAGPAMSAPHGGFAPAGHPGSASPMAARGPAPASRGAGYGTSRSLFPPPGITSTRPVYFSNGIARYGNSDRRGTRYGYNGGAVGFISPGYPGYLDFGYDPDFLDPTYNPNTTGEGSGLLPDAVINPQPPSMGGYGEYGGYLEPGYGSDGAGPAQLQAGGYPANSGYGSPPEGSTTAESEPAAAPTPFLIEPTRRAPAPRPAPLPEEDAVTIVFKDGRPPEQIHNYALTRTALYITAGKVRTIPVDDIDLPATEKANAKSGVDFQLPTK